MIHTLINQIIVANLYFSCYSTLMGSPHSLEQRTTFEIPLHQRLLTSHSNKVKNTPKMSHEFPMMTPTKKSPDRLIAPWTAPVKPVHRESKPTRLIRNRGIETLQAKFSPLAKISLEEKASQMANLKRDGASLSEPGLGSGVLIGKDFLLTARHCLKSAKMSATFTDFRTPLPITHTFRVEGILYTDSAQAKELGLLSGLHPDLVLLKLAPSPTGQKAGDLLGFTTVSTPSKDTPKRLTYYGFTSGNNLLKSSESEIRPYALTTGVSRNWLKVGHQITWNAREQGGIVERLFERDGKTYVKVRSDHKRSPNGIKHTFVVQADGTVTKLKKSGVISVPDVLIEPSVLIGTDHIIITHATSDGSSGGAYFTEDGELFAIHIGRFKDNLFKGATEQGFEHHIAFFPWAENNITFYEPYIKQESRFELANFNNTLLKKVAESFKNHELKISGESYGIISKVNSEHNGFYQLYAPGLKKPLKIPKNLSQSDGFKITTGADTIQKEDIVIESPLTLSVPEAKPDTQKAVLRRFEDYVIAERPSIQSFVGGTHHVILDKKGDDPAVKAHLGAVKYKKRPKETAQSIQAIKVYLDPENGISSKQRALYIIDGTTSSVSYIGRGDH